MIERTIQFLVRQSRKEHSLAARALATMLGATLFIVVIPAFIWWASRIFGRARMLTPELSRISALLCFIIGVPWVVAAVAWQLVYGKGTPVPAVPTRNFLQNGPYRYVRNPMMMGFFIYILGWALLINLSGALAAAALVASALLAWIKFIEEPELERRFKEAYLEYKRETPFFVPCAPRARKRR